MWVGWHHDFDPQYGETVLPIVDAHSLLHASGPVGYDPNQQQPELPRSPATPALIYDFHWDFSAYNWGKHQKLFQSCRSPRRNCLKRMHPCGMGYRGMIGQGSQLTLMGSSSPHFLQRDRESKRGVGEKDFRMLHHIQPSQLVSYRVTFFDF